MPTVNFSNPDYGSITYSVDKSGLLMADESITVKVTFKPKLQKMYGYGINLMHVGSDSSGWGAAEGLKTIAKGSSGSVTVSIPISKAFSSSSPRGGIGYSLIS